MFSGRDLSFEKIVWKVVLMGAVLSSLLPAADTGPSYTAAGIVHAATQTVQALAPNTIATIYGTNLAFATHAISTGDIRGGALPTSLEGVGVVVNSITASLFFVSPTQINFLVPYELLPGTVTVYVARQNLAGPLVKIQLNSAAPGMFIWNGNMAIAAHLNGSVISREAPAVAGEIIVVYATGLGRVAPDTITGKIASGAATIVARSQLQILLDGVACPAPNVLYAGLAPGFAGLYQINLKLPSSLPLNPEIRLVIGSASSPSLIQLATVSSPGA